MNGRWLAGMGAAVLAAGAAPAQVPPGAGQVLQRNPAVNPDRINEEQRRRLEERANPVLAAPARPEVEAPPPAPDGAGTAAALRFTLTAVDFDPSSYLSKAELDALVAPLIGREIAFADLQGAVDRINALYAARGLTTARALLPAQQIEGGRVRIRLVEGRIGATTVEGGSAAGRRYAGRRGALPAGALATPSALEGRLRQFNTNNDGQLRARLVPGTGFGNTDVALALSEPARVSADLFTDNNGFSSTGEAEVGAVLRGYRLFSDSDRATAVLVKARGVFSGNLSYSQPIGDRFRVGVSGSYGRTRVLFGPVAALGVRGTSYGFGADAAALLLLTDKLTVTGTGSVQTSLSRTSVSGQRVIENNALNTTLGVTAGYAVAGFAATVGTQATLAIVKERLSGTQVRPVLFQGSALIVKAVVPRVQARLRGDWQLATRSGLPGLLQYQIGGLRSSRAFQPGVAAGDHGYSAAAELAYGTVYDGLAIEPFLLADHAETALPGQKSSASSVGAGLNLTFAPRLAVRATVATSVRERGGIDGGTKAYISATLHL